MDRLGRTLLAALLAGCTSAVIPRVEHEPATDEDRDTVVGSDDRCPDEAEDADGVRDDDGCPDRDEARDGKGERDDRRPRTPEDVDRLDDDGRRSPRAIRSTLDA